MFAALIADQWSDTRCRRGTGKLTDAVLPCGVTAAAVLVVEPDDEMRAQMSRPYQG
ncbi:MAG TPA: hypothetical protein VFA63_00745 [Pseudonocardiaceae bacterium]|nr:hypothetical protein [Pseudonocardiaceae bacterium]